MLVFGRAKLLWVPYETSFDYGSWASSFWFRPLLFPWQIAIGWRRYFTTGPSPSEQPALSLQGNAIGFVADAPEPTGF